jgi:hypothetical protein
VTVAAAKQPRFRVKDKVEIMHIEGVGKVLAVRWDEIFGAWMVKVGYPDKKGKIQKTEEAGEQWLTRV